MYKICVAITAVPRRAQYVLKIKEQLAYPCQVFWDTAYRGAWWNGQRSYQYQEPGATHLLVLQDDISLCPNLIQGCLRLLELLPENVICLYNPSSHAQDVLAKGGRWMTTYSLPAPALLFPMEIAQAWVKWSYKFFDPIHWGEDERLSAYLTTYQSRAWIPCPSWVQHLLPGESTLGNSNKKRVAKQVLEVDPCTLDWSQGMEHPPHASWTPSPVTRKLQIREFER